MKPTFKIDGISLDDPARRWYLEASTKGRTLPAKNSRAFSIPRQHGATWLPGDTFGPGTIGISLIVTDRSPTGVIRDASQTQRNIDDLAELFLQANALLIVEQLFEGEARIAEAEVTAATEPQALNQKLTRYRLSFVLSVPGSFWMEPSPQVWDSPPNGTFNKTSVTTLQGSTAPAGQPIFRFSGPFAAASVTEFSRSNTNEEVASGTLFVQQAVPAGNHFFVELWTLSAWISTRADQWQKGMSAELSASLEYGSLGVPTLTPTRKTLAGMERTVVLSAVFSNAGPTTKLALRARKQFL